MAEYHLTYDQEQELTRRLANDPSATYGFENQGRTTYDHLRQMGVQPVPPTPIDGNQKQPQRQTT